MKRLLIVDEFRTEAQNSLFTKTQAMAITIRLLQLELAAENTPEEAATLSAMLKKFDFHYLDENQTDIDRILDDANVARLTAESILNAIELVKFDVQ